YFLSSRKCIQSSFQILTLKILGTLCHKCIIKESTFAPLQDFFSFLSTFPWCTLFGNIKFYHFFVSLSGFICRIGIDGCMLQSYILIKLGTVHPCGCFYICFGVLNILITFLLILLYLVQN